MRCVPPENRPTPAEIATCRHFLVAELDRAPDAPRALLALGRIAHEFGAARLGLRAGRAIPSRHGGVHRLPDGRILASSFHTSRYNVNTGRLTEAMFDAVVARLAAALAAGAGRRGQRVTSSAKVADRVQHAVADLVALAAAARAAPPGKALQPAMRQAAHRRRLRPVADDPLDPGLADQDRRRDRLEIARPPGQLRSSAGPRPSQP